jgi:hypothetical protein
LHGTAATLAASPRPVLLLRWFARLHCCGGGRVEWIWQTPRTPRTPCCSAVSRCAGGAGLLLFCAHVCF